MFFDMHTDILYDIVNKKQQGKRNIIKDNHLLGLIKGEFIGGIWTYYTDIRRPLCEFERAIDFILEEIESAHDVIHIVKKAHDFTENKLNIVLGFESLQPVKDVEALQRLYQFGFRHAMLTWNEENQFATGVKGNPERGITDEGKAIIQFMNDHNMIVDVSHANKKSFYDILETTNTAAIASHSNVKELCESIRNLETKQIKTLTDKGGLMALTAVKGFINPNKPTINQMIRHLDYLKDMDLLKQIGFGFDFMDYLGGSNLDDLTSAEDAPRLKEKLLEHGYLPNEIADITYKNALNFMNKIL